jgi:hypothetical protein
MVSSSMITIAADGEHMTCGGFSLSKIVRLVSFEFIANYFGGLSLSPRRGDSGATLMGSTHNGTPSPRRVMIEDSAEEFLTTSRGEGGSALPSPRRCDMGALPATVTATIWMENDLATQTMMMVPVISPKFKPLNCTLNLVIKP